MSEIRTADAVIFTGDRRDTSVLMIRRAYEPYAGHWALPGGHVDPDEHSLDAAVRELREETGLALPTVELEFVATFDTPGRDPRGPYISDAYTTELPGRARVTGSDDAATARWISHTELDELPLAFDHRAVINAAAQLLDQHGNG